MLDFESLQTAIKAWVTGTVTLKCVWENEKRPALGKLPAQAQVILSEPDSIRAIGIDYVLNSVDPENPLNVIPTLVGRREFLVVVKAVGRSQTPNRSSRYHAEILRSSFAKPSVQEHFRANEIAIVRPEPIHNFDAPFDGRVEPISAFNLILSCALALSTDTSQDTIGSVKLSSSLQDTGGNTLPVPPNLDDYEIPQP